MIDVLKTKATLKELSQKLESLYGHDFLSLILFGSLVTGDLHPGSDINTIVLLREASLKNLGRFRAKGRVWLKRLRSFPIFMDPDQLNRSVNTHPLEVSEIKDFHRVVHGEDMFSSLSVDKNLLRWNCERSLAEVILNLNSYASSVPRGLNLMSVSLQSINSLIFILKGLLRYWDKTLPSMKREVIEEFTDIIEIPLTSAKLILKVRFNEILPPVDSDGEAIFNSYLSEITRLANWLKEGGRP